MNVVRKSDGDKTNHEYKSHEHNAFETESLTEVSICENPKDGADRAGVRKGNLPWSSQLVAGAARMVVTVF